MKYRFGIDAILTDIRTFEIADIEEDIRQKTTLSHLLPRSHMNDATISHKIPASHVYNNETFFFHIYTIEPSLFFIIT